MPVPVLTRDHLRMIVADWAEQRVDVAATRARAFKFTQQANCEDELVAVIAHMLAGFYMYHPTPPDCELFLRALDAPPDDIARVCRDLYRELGLPDRPARRF